MEDHSTLVQVFRTETHVRIVDAFLTRHYVLLSASDLAEKADVNESSVSRRIDDLLDSNIIEEVETSGRSQCYQLNKDNESVELLKDLRYSLVTS